MITYSVDNLPCSIQIGVQGDSLEQFGFDFTSWAEQYGSGIFQIVMKRNGEQTPYPVTGLTVDGTLATWTVSAADTEIPGVGKIELWYSPDNGAKLSEPIAVMVVANIGIVSSPPDPLDTWLDRMADYVTEAQQAVTDAEGAVADASGYADNAEASADDAAAYAAQARGYIENAITFTDNNGNVVITLAEVANG